MAVLPGSQYVDPRMQMAQQMLRSGTDTSPISHWTQGAARLAQALAGSYLQNKSTGDQQAAMKALVQGLNAKPWTNPDTGTVAPGTEGGLAGALRMLSELDQNPYATQTAAQLAIGQATNDIERTDYSRERADKIADFEKQLQLKAKYGLDAGQDPAAVKEYQFYKGLKTDEEKKAFMALKRANPYLNLGDRLVQPNPMEPGQEMGAFPKGIPPQRQIDTAGNRVISLPAVPGGPMTPVPQGVYGKPPDSGIPAVLPNGGAAGVQDLPTSQKEARKEEIQKKQQARYANVVIEDIDRALDIIRSNPNLTTGLGYATAAIYGTPGHDLARLMDTVKANTGFERLQEMRNASSTGSALGAVSELENRLLQATIGNLEQSQSRDQLEYNLRRVKDLYLDIIHGPGNRPDAPTPEDDMDRANVMMETESPKQGQVEDGYQFMGGDPADPSSWKKVR